MQHHAMQCKYVTLSHPCAPSWSASAMQWHMGWGWPELWLMLMVDDYYVLVIPACHMGGGLGRTLVDGREPSPPQLASCFSMK